MKACNHSHSTSPKEDCEHLIEEMVHLNKRAFHLERSNKEMLEFDPKDTELQGYVKENEGYIAKYKLRIQEIMDILIIDYGFTVEQLDEGLKQTIPVKSEESKEEIKHK